MKIENNKDLIDFYKPKKYQFFDIDKSNFSCPQNPFDSLKKRKLNLSNLIFNDDTFLKKF